MGDVSNPRMFPGDGEPGLADDNERSIAMLRIALATLEKERQALAGEYLSVRRAQDHEIWALRDQIELLEAKRAHGGDDHGQGEGTRGRLAETDRPRQLPE